LSKEYDEIDRIVYGLYNLTKEEMFAKIDEGIAEYKAGKTKTLDPKDINSFLGLL